jgi:hypothetical protein
VEKEKGKKADTYIAVLRLGYGRAIAKKQACSPFS